MSTILEVASTPLSHRHIPNHDEEADVKEALQMHNELCKFAGELKNDYLWWLPIVHRNPQHQAITLRYESNYTTIHKELQKSYQALVDIASGSSDRDVLEQSQLYRRIARQCVHEQAFFTTSGRSLGMGSSSLQKGDKIVIFLGGQTPFAIRPTGKGTYRLLGEVYVLGLMHGEFLARTSPVRVYLLE